MRQLIVLASLLAASTCRSSSRPITTPAADGAAAEAAAADRTRRSAIVRIHMRDHYGDLRTIERHLVEGELAAVRDYAIALAYERTDPELRPWAPQLARMREAALALGTAGDVHEAARLEPALAAACADCHVEAGATVAFAPVPLPADDGTALARMDRHQWAADRLWEGLIAPSEALWKAGLDVLAASPVPERELTTVARPGAHRRIGELGAELQRTARGATSAASSSDRAATYGAILKLCAGCHDLAR